MVHATIFRPAALELVVRLLDLLHHLVVQLASSRLFLRHKSIEHGLPLSPASIDEPVVDLLQRDAPSSSKPILLLFGRIRMVQVVFKPVVHQLLGYFRETRAFLRQIITSRELHGIR